MAPLLCFKTEELAAMVRYKSNPFFFYLVPRYIFCFCNRMFIKCNVSDACWGQWIGILFGTFARPIVQTLLFFRLGVLIYGL